MVFVYTAVYVSRLTFVFSPLRFKPYNIYLLVSRVEKWRRENDWVVIVLPLEDWDFGISRGLRQKHEKSRHYQGDGNSVRRARWSKTKYVIFYFFGFSVNPRKLCLVRHLIAGGVGNEARTRHSPTTLTNLLLTPSPQLPSLPTTNPFTIPGQQSKSRKIASPSVQLIIFGMSKDKSAFDHSTDADIANEITGIEGGVGGAQIEQTRLRNWGGSRRKQSKESVGTPEFTEMLFNSGFKTDIIRLRAMEDMWKTRKPPEPLDYAEIIGNWRNKASLIRNVSMSRLMVLGLLLWKRMMTDQDAPWEIAEYILGDLISWVIKSPKWYTPLQMLESTVVKLLNTQLYHR